MSYGFNSSFTFCQSFLLSLLHSISPPLGPNLNPISNETAPAAVGNAPAINNLPHVPSFVWGDLDDESFCQAVNAAYSETQQWKKNLFPIPHSNAGKRFVRELNRLFRAYEESSALERIALASTAIMPILLLQNPSSSSKPKDHSQHLERRIHLWEKGDINNLVIEGRAIQTHFPKNRVATKRRQESTARKFADHMFHGDVSGATKLLTKSKGSVLRASDPIGDLIVLDVLREKHPQARPVTQEALIANPSVDSTDPSVPALPHPIIFEQITAKTIKNAALHTKGSAGPSGLDSRQWKRPCTSFKTASADLCHSLALIARRLCSSEVDPNHLAPLLTCRLIALDKCPGVRPIGVCETHRRIIAKAILSVTKGDILEATGTNQLCWPDRWSGGRHSLS